ncbi:hypothetical protein [Flavobacterium crassostreae]|uniref:Uncharacterized protein n=1 Tax=Flavobacterium crassostreae TaxID=1763534 RepID=A0A1B9E3L3_9FLAO|nr:hypothetical protein [Flavobacterium crassostreae]OCB76517.1 hypothetical protein LPBF_06140 [Flavobacterium crassostreae]
MTKSILIFILATFCVFSCQKNTPNNHKIPATDVVAVPKKDTSNTTTAKTTHFEGKYLYGKKQGGAYWIEVKITDLKNQQHYNVTVQSKEIKGKSCCRFNKTGTLKNDTLFIKTTDWKKPVTVIITKKNRTITIDAIEKEADDRYALNWYCCGGGSLMGDYTQN